MCVSVPNPFCVYPSRKNASLSTLAHASVGLVDISLNRGVHEKNITSEIQA